jgi:hypothetical protein
MGLMVPVSLGLMRRLRQNLAQIFQQRSLDKVQKK